ncbi:unnamed protein product [Sympodiomycopsis kandeliae]
MPDQSQSTSSTSPHTLETFRPLLKRLILSLPIPSINETRSLPSSLTKSELELLFSHLSDPSFTSNHAHQAQLGSILSGMRLGGLDAQSDTLTIASEAFLKRAIHVDSQDDHLQSKGVRDEVVRQRLQEEQGWTELLSRSSSYNGTLDLVGTGGDGQDTFNVSTTAAIVASGVPGVRICKHGAKASSSTSGSADLLLSLGIPLLSLTPPIISDLLPTSSFVFLFAQLFHPSLAPLGPIRRALGHPTIFNVLGPLINPAKPSRCILGVHSAYLGQIFAEALLKRGCERAWIVCGKEGLDEISIEGETDVWELTEDKKIKHFVISPKDFGLKSHPLKNVASNSSDENAAIVLHLTQPGNQDRIKANSGEPLQSPLTLQPSSLGTEDQDTLDLLSSLPPIPAGTHLEAIADYTILQTAALLYIGGYADDYHSAASLAKKSLNSGSALRSLQQFRKDAKHQVQEQNAKEQKHKEEKEAEQRHQKIVQGQKDVKDSVDRRRDSFFYAPEPIRSIGVGTSD